MQPAKKPYGVYAFYAHHYARFKAKPKSTDLNAGFTTAQVMTSLRISTWNANGLSQHKLELAQFLLDNHFDVILRSETHLTNKCNFQLRGYSFYGTSTDGKAHGGTGILIRIRIKHHYHNKFAKNYLQATSINIQLNTGNELTLAAVYCPPRFTIDGDDFM